MVDHPPARRSDVVDVLHGRPVGGLPGRDALAERLRALRAAGAVGAPARRAGRAFWTGRDPGQVRHRRAAGGARVAAGLLAVPSGGGGTAYPATLLTVALQAATTSSAAVVLRNEHDVGHGARSTSRTVALGADSLAFLAAHTGLEV